MKQLGDKRVLVTLLVLTGFLVGLGASNYLSQSSNYCSNVEQQIRQNQSFNGSVACYRPGVIDVNLSREVKQSSELKCVCRIISGGSIRIFPVTVTS